MEPIDPHIGIWGPTETPILGLGAPWNPWRPHNWDLVPHGTHRPPYWDLGTHGDPNSGIWCPLGLIEPHIGIWGPTAPNTGT